MPVRLTSSDYKVIAIAALVAAASVGVGLKYFKRAFPEAAIEFRVNRDDSRPIAERFLLERGLRPGEGYRHVAVFDFDDEAKVYLERTQGLERMNDLTRGPIHLWRWSHRWFRPRQKEEFRVDVSPAGEVVAFEREVPEAAPSPSLDSAGARALAEKFLLEIMRRDLALLEFVETETEKRPARTDHSFTWKQRDVDLGEGALRLEVEVVGDQVAAFREFVKIPEQWSRDYQRLRSHNVSAQLVAEVFLVLFAVALLVVLVQRLRDRDVPVRLGLGFGAVAATLYFLGQLNTFSLAEFAYQTTDAYSSFVTSYIRTNLLAALGLGAFIFLLVAGGEPVYRESFPGQIALRRYLSWPGMRSRSFFMANVVGFGLTFLFFAYQTLFYLAAGKLGAWAPAEVPFTNLLNTRIPWVTVLFIGFFPAVSEEVQFRAFGIPFLGNLLRSKSAALLLTSFIWGFLHSAYPNQPFFIRGIEVGVAGLLVGLIMLRFGILSVLIWHYSIDALYTAFLLLRSPNNYLMISGGLTAGIMLIPFLFALVAYWRTGTFADESGLTNASAGLSRVPRRVSVAEAELRLAYQPLSKRRLVWAGLLTAGCVALAFVPTDRLAEGIKFRITSKKAIRLADAYMRSRSPGALDSRRAVWLEENVDRLALRYILERRPVSETDRVYRRATKWVLWQVRYYRPLHKDEYRVSVDPETGEIFSCQHLLDENAPGATLSAEEAELLAGRFLTHEGYSLADFVMQDRQVTKRKARQDYTLVWEARPGDPRNVEEARFRLQVNVAGDEIAGLERFFHLPEEWERERRATGLHNAILMGVTSLFFLGLVGGALILFVRQVRRGQIPWWTSAKVGVVVCLVMLVASLNQLPSLYERYNTSEPLAAFQLQLFAGLAVSALLGGLLGWLLVGLVLSLYPNAWRVFRRSARSIWRRDAAVAALVSVAAMVAVERIAELFGNVLPAYAPVYADLSGSVLGGFSPAVGLFLSGALSAVLIAVVAGMAVYGARLGIARRAWWFWVGMLLLLISLGPTRARSPAEFLVGWAIAFIALAAAATVVASFFRDNILAYVAAGFVLPVAESVVKLLIQPAVFYRWNGVALAVLVAAVLGWMFVPWRRRPAPSGEGAGPGALAS